MLKMDWILFRDKIKLFGSIQIALKKTEKNVNERKKTKEKKRASARFS